MAALEGALSNPEEQWWLAEQNRLRGGLLLLTPGCEVEAEACLRQAIEGTAAQGARSLKLRAATHLASLLEEKGRVEEACDLLAPRPAWFRSDLDTRDLREARQVLERLQIAD